METRFNALRPFRLSKGSHQAGSGAGCAMNFVSYLNGDTKITDFPACSDRMLSKIVQTVNDDLAGFFGVLSPEDSAVALELGALTIGTTAHNLTDLELKQVYVKCAIYAARKVLYLTNRSEALEAIEAAERWVESPTDNNHYAAAAAADAATDAVVGATRAAAYAADAARAAAYAADAATDAVGAAARAATDAYAAAYAADAARAAAYAADVNAGKVELAREIIALFRELTGVEEVTPEQSAVTNAIECMLRKG